MERLISVIVPVYKVERYLPRCIESILKQTYKNFELILVDDGSPDRSGEICDYYAKKDSRIKVIHKENGGVSSARNAGIDAAQGEYINFVDSDDWISLDCLEKLYNAIKKSDADMSVGGMEHREISLSQTIFYMEDTVVCQVEESLPLYRLLTEYSALINSPVAKLLSKSIIDNNQLRFYENVKMGEDSLFMYGYLAACRTIYVLKSVVYFYNRMNEKSATRSSYSLSKMLEWNVLRMQAYINLLKGLRVSSQIKEQMLTYMTFYSILTSWRKKDAVPTEEEIVQTLALFEQWLFVDRQWEKISEIDAAFRDAIFKRDIDKLNQLNESTRQKKSLKQTIKNGIKRFLTPFIEKHRDGLIKYKPKK